MLYLAPLGEVENYYGLEFNRVAIDDAPRDWSLAEYERIRAMCRSGSRPQTVVAYGPPGPEWVTQGNGITRNGGRPYLGPHVTVLVSHRRRRWIYLPLGANDGPSFISYATAPAKTSPIT
jgi:hypothetical protein